MYTRVVTGGYGARGLGWIRSGLGAVVGVVEGLYGKDERSSLSSACRAAERGPFTIALDPEESPRADGPFRRRRATQMRLSDERYRGPHSKQRFLEQPKR